MTPQNRKIPTRHTHHSQYRHLLHTQGTVERVYDFLELRALSLKADCEARSMSMLFDDPAPFATKLLSQVTERRICRGTDKNCKLQSAVEFPALHLAQVEKSMEGHRICQY